MGKDENYRTGKWEGSELWTSIILISDSNQQRTTLISIDFFMSANSGEGVGKEGSTC